MDLATGKVEVNDDVLVRYSACLGCYSSCGNRVKLDRATGKMLTIGGNGGAKPGVGNVIAEGLSEEELLALLDKIYQYFEVNKNGKERTIRTVERLGLDHLKAAVLSE